MEFYICFFVFSALLLRFKCVNSATIPNDTQNNQNNIFETICNSLLNLLAYFLEKNTNI